MPPCPTLPAESLHHSGPSDDNQVRSGSARPHAQQGSEVAVLHLLQPRQDHDVALEPLEAADALDEHPVWRPCVVVRQFEAPDPVPGRQPFHYAPAARKDGDRSSRHSFLDKEAVKHFAQRLPLLIEGARLDELGLRTVDSAGSSSSVARDSAYSLVNRRRVPQIPRQDVGREPGRWPHLAVDVQALRLILEHIEHGMLPIHERQFQGRPILGTEVLALIHHDGVKPVIPEAQRFDELLRQYDPEVRVGQVRQADMIDLDPGRLCPFKAEIVEDLEEAIEKGLSMTQDEDLLCITGSLYTVGEARAYFRPRERS